MFLFSTIIELWTATDGEGRSTEALDESDVLQLYMINPYLHLERLSLPSDEFQASEASNGKRGCSFGYG